MRRLNNEDGAVAVIAALLLAVLVGIGVLVLDVGNLYWERRSLQNGADSAALAAAQDFASGEGAIVADATARTFADANNTRGAFVASLVHPTPNSVRVVTRTGDVTAQGELSSILAGVLNVDEYFATASATAAWGAAPLPHETDTLPVTFSLCDLMGGAGPYTLAEIDAKAATLPKITDLSGYASGTVTGGVTVTLHDPKDGDACTVKPGFSAEAETKMPGGFGWLDTVGKSCKVNILSYEDSGEFWVPSESGMSPEGRKCLVDSFQKAPTIPVFTGFRDKPAKTYRLYAPAAFYITGYHVPGESKSTTCKGSNWCLHGYFVQKIDLDGAPPVGGGPSLGVDQVWLTE
jgi:Flp pilus assembly protein TadG